MKFRIKIFFFFALLSLVSSFFPLYTSYRASSQLMINEIRSKVLSLAINTVQLVNPAVLERYIASKGKEKGPDFYELKRELRDIRNLNRQSDAFVLYAYIIRKDKNSNRYYHVINSETHDPFSLKYGSPVDPPDPNQSTGLREAYVTKVYSDRWGHWLTGCAPIFNQEGKNIGLLAIDIQLKEIHLQLRKLLIYGIAAFFISIFLGIIFAYFLSKYISSSLSSLSKTVKTLTQGDLSVRSHLQTRDEFHNLSTAINNMAKGLEERDKLKLGFSRYVSEHVLEEIIHLDKPVTLEGEKKNITVLFSSIHGFSTIAEKLSPEKVLDLLNEYLREMTQVIFQYGGTLDKFIGSGLMVEFGAPLDDTLQEFHAVLAAIQMQVRLDTLRKKWAREGRDLFSVGIGIHTGPAILGTVGSEKRMEYTAIGDTVNVASRLEKLTKELNRPILISKTVYDKVKNQVIIESLGKTILPGRVGDIEIYAIDPNKAFV